MGVGVRECLAAGMMSVAQWLVTTHAQIRNYIHTYAIIGELPHLSRIQCERSGQLSDHHPARRAAAGPRAAD